MAQRKPTLAELLPIAPPELRMSSGLFGRFAPCGLLVLEDAGLRPGQIAGPSVGAPVAGRSRSGGDGVRFRDELPAMRSAAVALGFLAPAREGGS